MKPLQKTLCVTGHVVKSCTKATVAVSHFVISKVIGAGGSVTIQSLLLASNAWLLYAGRVLPKASPAYITVAKSPFCASNA